MLAKFSKKNLFGGHDLKVFHSYTGYHYSKATISSVIFFPNSAPKRYCIEAEQPVNGMTITPIPLYHGRPPTPHGKKFIETDFCLPNRC